MQDFLLSCLQYISIQQYIDTVNKYRDIILHLEHHDTRNTPIQQSVTALIEYIKAMLQYSDSFTDILYLRCASLIAIIMMVVG